jgi:hypothetical protein
MCAYFSKVRRSTKGTPRITCRLFVSLPHFGDVHYCFEPTMICTEFSCIWKCSCCVNMNVYRCEPARHQPPCVRFNSSDPKHLIAYSAPERSIYDTTIPDIAKMSLQRIETYYRTGCCKFDCADRRLWHDKPPQHTGKSNTNSRYSTTDFDNHFSNSRGDCSRCDNSHHHRDCERHRRGIGGQGRCVGRRRHYLQRGHGDNHMEL